MKPKKQMNYLKDYQVQYIKENADKLSIRQMAKAIGCSDSSVYMWCKKLHIRPNKECFQNEVPVIPPCTPLVVSGKADIIPIKTKYDNKSRDERINELLQMDI